MPQADQGTLAADDIPVTPEAVPAEENTDPRVYAGTFKDPDALEKGYGELSGRFDIQGNELGTMRTENETLRVALAEAQKPVESAVTPEPTDFQGMQSALAKQYEDGDIDFPTYAKESNALTAQAVQEQAQVQLDQTLSKANDQFSQTLQERDDQVTVDKFHSQYPDFAEKQASGALQATREANPMFDDMTAYFALTAQEAKEAGKAEQAKLESGSLEAGKVLADPGTVMQTQKRPVGEAALKASMLASLT